MVLRPLKLKHIIQNILLNDDVACRCNDENQQVKKNKIKK